MYTYTRLLELAGQKIIMEAMSPKQAQEIFRFHGASDDDLKDQASLKKFRNQFMMTNHSDISGGNDDAAKEINAAYDILKTMDNPNSTSDYSDYTSNRHYRERSKGPPPWETDRYSSNWDIRRDNYNDLNYIKKKMWELSNHSKQKFTVLNFDGSFFRGQFTVFGSSKIFKDMADAMRGWDRYNKPRAIFIKHDNREKPLYLAWLDKHVIDDPVNIYDYYDDTDDWDGNEINQAPYNNQRFMSKLPEILDEISVEYGFTAKKKKWSLKDLNDKSKEIYFGDDLVGYLKQLSGGWQAYDEKKKRFPLRLQKTDIKALNAVVNYLRLTS